MRDRRSREGAGGRGLPEPQAETGAGVPTRHGDVPASRSESRRCPCRGSVGSNRHHPNHPFWSEDKQQFVRADALQPGEHLRQADGSLTTVMAVIPCPGTHNVYNIEVHGEHVYQVGYLGVLVHNTCMDGVANFADELSLTAQAARRHLRRNVPGTGGQAHRIIPFETRSHELVMRAAQGGDTAPTVRPHPPTGS